ncbi:fluoride efflux transporter FluC [Pseudarthrobacter sp. P1]|uniref:fluoride efflux transporter FluC n=1 Tax=Pseudarthrobacter sp. P1 TaxID=3418418 RepID=UPI003CFA172C
MLINTTGSLLLGLLTGRVAGHYATPALGLVMGTGFLGGYTTFSTASFETIRLIQSRRTGMALVNALGTMAACVLAAAAGTGIATLL